MPKNTPEVVELVSSRVVLNPGPVMPKSVSLPLFSPEAALSLSLGDERPQLDQCTPVFPKPTLTGLAFPSSSFPSGLFTATDFLHRRAFGHPGDHRHVRICVEEGAGQLRGPSAWPAGWQLGSQPGTPGGAGKGCLQIVCMKPSPGTQPAWQ